MTSVLLERAPWETAPALPRLLGTGRKLAEHREAYGGLPLRTFAGEEGRARLIQEVTQAGLRGRGGAGFPTGRKLASVASGKITPVVLANGCESEPASRKDKTLLAHAPHLVLDGAVLAAHAVGAEKVIICVERGGSLPERLERELAQRKGDPVKWQIARIPRRYVSSEESALVHFVNSGDGRPIAVPPRPFERGVDGRPTLVDNVETLAHIALIARYGPDWFREVGTQTDPGSTLVTIGGAVARPNVYEIVPGMRIGEVLDAAGGATVTLGAGAIFALPADACGLAETARITRYLAEESAGQCGPCVFGLPAIADDLRSVAFGRCGPATRQRLMRRIETVTGRGACRHPDGATRFATSALTTFAEDLETHLNGWTCSGVSRDPMLPLPKARDRGWR
jgi:NADH:ubiquinone oxidoreductase subunit F (NADH-binding)